jgi:ankyrin repeat protein
MSCSSSNWTPLQSASSIGAVDVCRALVSAQADAAARDRCDAIYRLLRALMMLFASHAPPCSLGNTPLKQAIFNNKPDVVVFLRSVGAPE